MDQHLREILFILFDVWNHTKLSMLKLSSFTLWSSFLFSCKALFLHLLTSIIYVQFLSCNSIASLKHIRCDLHYHMFVQPLDLLVIMFPYQAAGDFGYIVSCLEELLSSPSSYKGGANPSLLILCRHVCSPCIL